jgi:hypothetical protein
MPPHPAVHAQAARERAAESAGGLLGERLERALQMPWVPM